MVNVVLGTLIFGYAAYSITGFVKKSKQGKCAACAINKSCASSCSAIEEKQQA